MRSIQQHLQQFNDAGVRPVAISIDTPQQSRTLMDQTGYTFTFLSDPTLDAIRKYDLVHAGAGENGHDISRPAEFLIDSNGVVRWVNLTENYMVRAKVEQILEASKALP